MRCAYTGFFFLGSKIISDFNYVKRWQNVNKMKTGKHFSIQLYMDYVKVHIYKITYFLSKHEYLIFIIYESLVSLNKSIEFHDQ